jgi:hypothetical protein
MASAMLSAGLWYSYCFGHGYSASNSDQQYPVSVSASRTERTYLGASSTNPQVLVRANLPKALQQTINLAALREVRRARLDAQMYRPQPQTLRRGSAGERHGNGKWQMATATAMGPAPVRLGKRVSVSPGFPKIRSRQCEQSPTWTSRRVHAFPATWFDITCSRALGTSTDLDRCTYAPQWLEHPLIEQMSEA